MAKNNDKFHEILIVFDQNQAEDANRVTEWLEREGYARTIENREDTVSLHALLKIATDSALVFVSDEAVNNPEWQRTVRGIKDNVRLIPIGATENVDYTDPEVVPLRIESINFIRQDEFMLESILESLTTDPKFYAIKNSLQSQFEQWELSHRSDNFLLSDAKETKQFLSLIEDKLQTETEPHFADKLIQIKQFLNVSLVYSKKLGRERLIVYLRRFMAAFVVAIMIFAIVKIRPYVQRTYYSSTALAFSNVDFYPESTAIKMLGILTNPLIRSGEVKSQAISTLLSCLNKPWEHSPIGNSDWANNDFTITSKTDYIWTADSNGAITKWNRNNGQIENHEIISDKPLAFLSINQEETIFAAIDQDRTLFIKNTSVSNEWRRCDVDFDFQPSGIIMAEKDDTLSVIGDSDVCIISVGKAINVLANHRFEEVFNVVVSTDTGFCAVVKDGAQNKFVKLKVGDIVSSAVIPGQIYSGPVYTGKVAISNGQKVAFVNDQAQLVVWNYDEPEQLKRTGISCPNLTDIKFLNDQTVVFSDRNQGTHLLDIIQMIDLGQVLTNASSINRLVTLNNQVVGKTATLIHSQDVTDLLPLRNLNEDGLLGVFDSTECTFGSGIVRSLKITNDYLILARVLINNKEETILIDGSCKLASGSDQVKNALLQNIDKGYYAWPASIIGFTGKPTVVGILPDGCTVLIGAEDGSFHELRFSKDGSSVMILTRKQIASKSPVQKIFHLHDSYYILDSDKLLWKSRQATTLQTIDDCIEAFKKKNHMPFDSDLLKSISPELVERLNLELTPVAAGEG